MGGSTRKAPIYDNHVIYSPVAGASAEELHGDKFTAGAILKGDAAHNLPETNFEKKAFLINL